jgi:hypothetical protein
MTAVKRQHLAQLHKLRDELYAKLSPQEQRRIDDARQARLDWRNLPLWRRYFNAEESP